MPNSFDTTLAALNPLHTWKFDEASGNYLDSGSGSTPLVPIAGGDTWRRAPGVIRGAPVEYAYWTTEPNTSGAPSINASNVTDLNAGGWNSGAIVICGAIFSAQEEQTLLHLTYDSVTTQQLAIIMRTDRSIKFELQDPANTNRYNISTPAATVTLGEPFMLVVVQRGDGSGIQILYNNVVQTLTTDSRTGTGTDNDAWVNELMSASVGACTRLSINNQNASALFGIGNPGIIQRPTIFVDNPPSAGQLSTLYSSANLDGIPQNLIHTLMELANNQQRYLLANVVPQTSINNASIVQAGVDLHDSINVFLRTSTSMGVSTFPQDTDIVDTDFDYFKFNIDPAAILPRLLTTTPSNFEATETTGTVCFTIDFDDGIPVGTTRTVWKLETNNAGTAFIKVSIGAATGPIYNIVAEINDGTNNYTITAAGVSLNINDYVMISLVQDGASGLELFLNGSDLSVAASGALSANAWINDLPKDAGDGLPQEVTYGGGAFGDDLDANQLGFFYWAPNALTGSEISQIWNAVNGIFPEDNPLTPPPGGFADTLEDTGNETDPNGPGPWHWWRLNEASGLPLDTGIATVKGDAIAIGGDPDYRVQGPLILDPTNEAIFFDGVGDYFEVGVGGVGGALVTAGIGTVGFFVSLKELSNDNIAYSQGNAPATAFIKFGVNNGFLELTVQTSTGNSVAYTSSIEITDFDFVFGVFTCDGSNYILYVDGVADTEAQLTTAGTGVEGDWFDSATWTRSAIAARADSILTTETAARFSELFIYEEVLTASQIAALFAAATADGVAGLPNANLRLVFEDVVLRNGGAADVRVINPRTDFNVALQVNRSRFLGGAEGDNAGVLLSGAVNGQINGNLFDLQASASSGRSAVKATNATPATPAAAEYSLLVSDNTFEGMGRADAPAVFLESGFAATIKANQFFNSFGGAIGWRGNIQNVNALRNLIDTVLSGSGISVQNGINTGVGRNWQVAGNTIINPAVRGISIEGFNSALAERARNVLVARNRVTGAIGQGIYVAQVRDARVSGNNVNGGTRAIEFSDLQNAIAAHGNTLEGFEDAGIYYDEATVNAVLLVIDANTINGDLLNDAIYVDGVGVVHIFDNAMLNMNFGIQLGEVTTAAKIYDNKALNNTTPIDLITGTAQAGLELGDNKWRLQGDILTLPVVANAVSVLDGYHEITSASAVDLNSIGGALRQGRTVILKVATGSSIITAKDGVGDMNLAGDFAMDPGDTITLVQNDAGTWDERGRSNNG